MWLTTIITGTKIHVAVEQNRLPVSIVVGSANIHDSMKFVSVMENISDHLGDESIKQIMLVYADRGYDAKYIQDF